METLLAYFVKVNAALFLFWICYRLLFERDTFFGVKRICLGCILLLSFLYPLADFSFLLPIESSPAELIRYMVTISWNDVVITDEPTVEVAFKWEYLLWTLYAMGMGFLLHRTITQAVGICRLASQSRRLSILNTDIVSPEERVAPFSFLGWIFVNPEEYTIRELQEIVAHERVHVRQGHSADMLASELVCIVCWFNPAAWLLRREIRKNLEFLADKEVVSAGFNRKNYQYHLLHLSHRPCTAQITNNFTVSQLKKRIVMMNKKRSLKIGLSKYLLLLPVTACLVTAGNASALVNHSSVIPQQVQEEVVPKPEKPTPPTKEENPRFQGDLLVYLKEHLKYPKEAVDLAISGNVFVEFTVTSSGKVTDARVVNSVHPSLDAEALRVIREMPDWIPGKMDGKAIYASFTLPISFKLPTSNDSNTPAKTPGQPSAQVLEKSDSVQRVHTWGMTKSVNNVLFIVDGIESSNDEINKLKPEEIKSITVMKDSASTKLYGERGINGVILIERIKK